MFERLDRAIEIIPEIDSVKVSGKITKIVGLLLESNGPSCSLGEMCIVRNKYTGINTCKAEVVGFSDGQVMLMAIGSLDGVGPGSEILSTGKKHSINISSAILGRVVDGFGMPIDSGGALLGNQNYSVNNRAPNPLTRNPINTPIHTGIKAIDGLLTIGLGQRVGIFAGSGVGKSTTLGMIARQSSADVNVIALIGERGREVSEFIKRDLGEKALKNSVIVVATSDQDALIRVKSAFVATSIAEYFRDQGKNVLLMMDSITRMCMAQREIGLTIGEPPTTKGYPPSVFSILPKLMERAGNNHIGSITALYTVLVEGDDMNDPIADAARGILDGHIVLSRRLASEGHYPSIDVLESVSRLMNEIVSPEHQKSAKHFFDLLANYKDAEDLINIGAYKKGANKKIDEAILKYSGIIGFLRQETTESEEFDEIINGLINLVNS